MKTVAEFNLVKLQEATMHIAYRQLHIKNQERKKVNVMTSIWQQHWNNRVYVIILCQLHISHFICFNFNKFKTLLLFFVFVFVLFSCFVAVVDDVVFFLFCFFSNFTFLFKANSRQCSNQFRFLTFDIEIQKSERVGVCKLCYYGNNKIFKLSILLPS